jgi:uncharacterized membrane protein
MVKKAVFASSPQVCEALSTKTSAKLLNAIILPVVRFIRFSGGTRMIFPLSVLMGIASGITLRRLVCGYDQQ